MKLSFIIPSYMGEKYIPKFIFSLVNQTDQNFEIVFIIDNTRNDDTLNLLQKLKLKYKMDIKILFNTKRQKRLTSIIEGINKASGTHISICSTQDIINKNFVKIINNIISKKNPEIIEYKFQYTKTKIIPPLNTPKNELINLKKDISIIANSIPFDFNKIIKITLAKKIGNFSYIDGASRFDISYIFNMMINAKTYYAIDEIIKNTHVFNKSLINPHRMMIVIKENIKKYDFLGEEEYLDAVLFYGWSALAIYQMQVLIVSKKNLAISRLHLSLDKMRNLNEYKYAALHNEYFKDNLLSTIILTTYPKINIYKKLILKWDY